LLSPTPNPTPATPASRSRITRSPHTSGSTHSASPVVSSSPPPSRNGVGSSSSLMGTQLTDRANVATSPWAVTRSAGSAARSASVTGKGRLLLTGSLPNCLSPPLKNANLHTVFTRHAVHAGPLRRQPPHDTNPVAGAIR